MLVMLKHTDYAYHADQLTWRCMDKPSLSVVGISDDEIMMKNVTGFELSNFSWQYNTLKPIHIVCDRLRVWGWWGGASAAMHWTVYQVAVANDWMEQLVTAPLLIGMVQRHLSWSVWHECFSMRGSDRQSECKLGKTDTVKSGWYVRVIWLLVSGGYKAVMGNAPSGGPKLTQRLYDTTPG